MPGSVLQPVELSVLLSTSIKTEFLKIVCVKNSSKKLRSPLLKLYMEN
jgi:hypothetical protein